jgi:hypothetical protein
MKKNLYILIAFFLFASCSTEWRLGNRFVKSNNAGMIFLFTSNEIFKEYSTWDKTNDSLLLLNEMPDSSFLNSYYNSLIEGLLQLNFKVCLDDIETSRLSDTLPNIVLNVAQISLEEYNKEYEESEEFYEGTYYKTINLKTLDLNFWFELSIFNQEEKPVLCFDSQSISDISNGYFYQKFLTGEVIYEEEIIPLKVEDVINRAKLLGKRHATMIYDLLLNTYIQNNYPNNKTPGYLLHFNPESRFLEPLDEENDVFQILSQ